MSKLPELMAGRALEHGISMLVDHGRGSGKKMYVGGQANAQVAAGTSHENTTTEASISQYVIPANTLAAGSTIRFWAAGVVEDSNSTDTLTIAVRFGTSSTATSNGAVFSSAAIDAADDDIYAMQGIIQFRTVGQSGTAVAILSYQDPDATGTAPKWNYKSSMSLNTTTALYLDITADWSVADADNEMNSEIFVVDIVNPST